MDSPHKRPAIRKIGGSVVSLYSDAYAAITIFVQYLFILDRTVPFSNCMDNFGKYI